MNNKHANKLKAEIRQLNAALRREEKRRKSDSRKAYAAGKRVGRKRR